MKNLLMNFWMGLKTLLAGLKQRFLVHPAEVAVEDAKETINTVKTDVETTAEKVKSVSENVVNDVEQGL